MAFDMKAQGVVAAPDLGSAKEFSNETASSVAYAAKRVTKRLMDIVLSLGALVALAPVMIVVAALIRKTDGGPVFFSHTRVGKDGKPFQCVKFRSMRTDGAARLNALLAFDPIARAEWEENQKLTRDPRVHALGDFIRRTSLDELPQFWNVLKGDMSLVGPRPITWEETARYGVFFDDYCAVKPGITGAWQVGGRSLVSYAERVKMDVRYVREAGLAEDVRILAKTVGVVLGRQGAC